MNISENGAITDDVASPSWYNPIAADPSWYNPATIAYCRYKWEVELGLQRRNRHFLIQEKRKMQNIINIYQKALKGPYGYEIFPEDIDKFRYELFFIKKELESLCD